MVVFAALVLAGLQAEPGSPPVQRVVAERQAVAMVRILPGAPVRFSEIEKNAPESLRDSQIRATDGSSQLARLVEFH